MTPANLVDAIDEAVPQLLKLARSLTWSSILDKCVFILSEITDEPTNTHERRHLIKRLNDAKRPQSLASLAPALHQLHGNLHDINLEIYRVTRTETVVDIRYYLRSSLSPTYRVQVANQPPMLHVKVAMPPWVGMTRPAAMFNINWERQLPRIWWWTWWARHKLRNF